MASMSFINTSMLFPSTSIIKCASVFFVTGTANSYGNEEMNTILSAAEERESNWSNA
jgi:hypothetical protein